MSGKRKICKSYKEVSDEIKKNADEILIEADAGKHILRIKATGTVAWGVCLASLGFAIAAILAAPVAVKADPIVGGAQFVSGAASSVVATSILGTSAVPAITLAVAAGGVGVLTKIRDKYVVTENNKEFVKLVRVK